MHSRHVNGSAGCSVLPTNVNPLAYFSILDQFMIKHVHMPPRKLDADKVYVGAYTYMN